MTLGEQIQACRKKAGLSQEALAEKLGVSRQAVSRWELDSALPELDKVVAMARLFGVTTDQLLGMEPPVQTAPAGTAVSQPPRWYLLGLLPLALGGFLLFRGLYTLVSMMLFLRLI